MLSRRTCGKSKFNFLKLEINNFFQTLVNGVLQKHCHTNQNVGEGLTASSALRRRPGSRTGRDTKAGTRGTGHRGS